MTSTPVLLSGVAHKPYWYSHITFIRRWLEALQEPVLDRRGIEAVFRVSPREATRILHQAGAWRLGAGLVVTRWQLLEWVGTVARGDDAYYSEVHRRKLADALDDAKSQFAGRPPVLIRPLPKTRTMEGLPAGIRLSPGRLEIDFFGAEDLAKHLFALSQAIVADFQRFEQMVE